MVILMQCEIKYIEHKVREEYKTLIIKGMSLLIVISSAVGITASFFLKSSTFHMSMALCLTIFLMGMWINAVTYCKNSKIINEKKREVL